VVASVALLAGTAWLFRRLAGTIFATGMLLYGKEPSLAEVVRWAREG
jgi:ABC-2 type transport system permease protein